MFFPKSCKIVLSYMYSDEWLYKTQFTSIRQTHSSRRPTCVDYMFFPVLCQLSQNLSWHLYSYSYSTLPLLFPVFCISYRFKSPRSTVYVCQQISKNISSKTFKFKDEITVTAYRTLIIFYRFCFMS